MKSLRKPLMVCIALALLPDAYAADLDDVLTSSEKKVTAAQQSQQKIDNLADKTTELFEEYRATGKVVEDLKVYNRKLEIQIDKQQQRLQQIEKSIAEVQVMQRQITPLIERMIDSLEQFVSLDIPFHKAEREQRIAFLRSNFDKPELSVAEKFRQVLEAYKIENEYGRKIDSYSDVITIDGTEREVTMFRVGRIALLYQTSDMAQAGMWDQQNRKWQPLDADEYRDAIRGGIRIANKQASTNILEVPVPAAEAM